MNITTSQVKKIIESENVCSQWFQLIFFMSQTQAQDIMLSRRCRDKLFPVVLLSKMLIFGFQFVDCGVQDNTECHLKNHSHEQQYCGMKHTTLKTNCWRKQRCWNTRSLRKSWQRCVIILLCGWSVIISVLPFFFTC